VRLTREQRDELLVDARPRVDAVGEEAEIAHDGVGTARSAPAVATTSSLPTAEISVDASNR
jgi:hypothetical protein